MELTFATWNIGGGKPSKDKNSYNQKEEDFLEEDPAYFASQLKEINPDIICLQETHIGPDKSLAREIGELIGEYHLVEEATSPSHIDSRYRLGIATLSKIKWEKEEFNYFPYPDFPLARRDGRPTVRHDKGVYVTKFAFGMVANLHMQPLAFLGVPYDTPEGQGYAKQLEEELEKHISNPVVICGDFNYGKSEELYSNLISKLSLKEVLPKVSTRPDKNRKSDYIFVSPEFSLIDSGVVETNSDHYLCWAKLKV